MDGTLQSRQLNLFVAVVDVVLEKSSFLSLNILEPVSTHHPGDLVVER